MSRWFQRTLTLALFLLVAAPIAGAEDLPQTIRFGAVGAGFGQQYGTQLISIAQVKGFVQQEFGTAPVKLEWNYFAGTGPAINEALAGGQLDFAQYGSIPQIIARANGVATKLILSGGGTNIYGVVRSALPVNSIKELKGLKVTVQKATILHWSLLETLKANGLSEHDITLVDLKTADQLAALAAGSVDAAFGTVNMLPLRDEGIVNVIYRSQRDDPRATGPSAFVVTDDFAKRYPDATLRVERGFVEAAHWVADPKNREEALQIWAKSGVSSASLRDEYAGEELGHRFNPLLDDFFRGQYREGIAFEKQEKLIRHDIDLAAWIDTSYQDAALKDLHLEGYWPHRDASGAAAVAASR